MRIRGLRIHSTNLRVCIWGRSTFQHRPHIYWTNAWPGYGFTSLRYQPSCWCLHP
jgi:hypothetical protein